MQARLTREESKAQTRERLLDAARHLFARGGYGGASVDAVAAEAGYSKGAFYSNFESKEAIFLALLEQHMVTEAEQLRALMDAGGDPADLLFRLDAWFKTMNADADWALLSMELQLQARRSASVAAAYEALFAKHRERLGALVKLLFSLSGKKLPAPAPQLAGALMALAHGLVLQRTGSPRGGDPAGPLLRTVLRSLITAAAPADRAD